MTAFLHGLILALGLILPLGAQNLFIFTQGAIQPNFKAMAPIIFFAGVSDTFLILAAIFGVSLVVLKIAWLKSLLVVIGVIFLLYIGWLTWKSDLAENNNEASLNWTLKKKIIFTLSVSLLNPHAILDTVGVIGTSSLAYQGDAKTWFTLACVAVSWLWFISLAVAGRLVGSFQEIRKVLNRVSAIIMWFSALYLSISFGM